MKPFSDHEREVAADSPGGKLIRREWLPAATSKELPSAGSKFLATVCDEKIVIARLQSGKLLAIQERCPHRGASFLYGEASKETIRCMYHGWEFDTDGKCINRPFDSSGDAGKVCARTFPIIERYGLVFVYLGQDRSPPPFRRFGNLEQSKLQQVSRRHSALECSWLTLQENAADVVHTYFLHGRMTKKLTGHDPTGFSEPMTAYGFQPKAFGLIKTWKYSSVQGRHMFGFGNLLVEPNILCIETEVHWRVPRTASTTDIYIVSLEKNPCDDLGVIEFKDENGIYLLHTPFGQDAMALETSDNFREEILGRSDYGVQLFRERIRKSFQAPTQNNLRSAIGHSRSDIIFPAQDFMGGFLPSTGAERSTNSEFDQGKWDSIRDENYVEFSLESDAIF